MKWGFQRFFFKLTCVLLKWSSLDTWTVKYANMADVLRLLWISVSLFSANATCAIRRQKCEFGFGQPQNLRTQENSDLSKTFPFFSCFNGIGGFSLGCFTSYKTHFTFGTQKKLQRAGTLWLSMSSRQNRLLKSSYATDDIQGQKWVCVMTFRGALVNVMYFYEQSLHRTLSRWHHASMALFEKSAL